MSGLRCVSGSSVSLCFGLGGQSGFGRWNAAEALVWCCCGVLAGIFAFLIAAGEER